jgi:hypothetical protein
MHIARSVRTVAAITKHDIEFAPILDLAERMEGGGARRMVGRLNRRYMHNGALTLESERGEWTIESVDCVCKRRKHKK